MPLALRKTLLSVAAGSALGVGAPAFAADGDSRFMSGSEVADAPQGFVEMCRVDVVTCAAGYPQVNLKTISDPAAPHLAVEDSAARYHTEVSCVLPADIMRPFCATGSTLPTAAILAPSRVPARFQSLTPSAAPADAKASLDWIKRVNADVNRHVLQRTDLQTYGVGELWRRPLQGRNAQGDCEDLAIEKRMQLLEQGFPADRLFYAVSYKPALGLHTVLVARLDQGDFVLDSYQPRVMKWHKTRYTWLRMQSRENPAEWLRVDSPRKSS